MSYGVWISFRPIEFPSRHSVFRSSSCAPKIWQSRNQAFAGPKQQWARAIAEEWLVACSNRVRVWPEGAWLRSVRPGNPAAGNLQI